MKTNTQLTETEVKILADRVAGMMIYEIADLIQREWKNVYFGAVPYLSAMHALGTIHEDYGADSGRSIVTYFLGNAQSFRGPVAKVVKAELNKRIKAR